MSALDHHTATDHAEAIGRLRLRCSPIELLGGDFVVARCIAEDAGERVSKEGTTVADAHRVRNAAELVRQGAGVRVAIRRVEIERALQDRG